MRRSNHQRVYDSWYATEEQLRLLDVADYHDNYVAQLRLDLLTFRTAVIPDTAIIDGWFFGQVTPDELSEWCGRGSARIELPIEIRARRATLEESLATVLCRPDRDTLNDYPLQLLRYPEARSAVAEGLGETKLARLEQLLTLEPTVPKAIARLLNEILKAKGVTDHTVERFLPYWEAWIDAERRGIVRTIEWDGVIDVLGAARCDPLNPPQDLMTREGSKAYERIMDLISKGKFGKSDALNILGSEVAESLDSTADGYAWDRAVILTWYDDARRRAIARQHRSTFAYDQVPIFVGEEGRAYRGLATLDDSIEDMLLVEVPSDFRLMLTELEPERYRNLFVVHGEKFRRLWTDPSPDNLRRVVDTAYEYAIGDQRLVNATKAEKLVRVFGQLLAAGAATEAAGPIAGLTMILASEGAFRAADSARKRRAIRSVVEYVGNRTSKASIWLTHALQLA
jgi:hypothetical protein